MEHDYWKKQSPDKTLFPDIEWNKPEQRSKAGKLGIIGGNSLGFAGVAESYATAQKSGVGEVRILLPDSLRKMVPSSISDVVFAATNPSGGLGKEAINEMRALGRWADEILLIGDAGKNSETAVLYEKFVLEYQGPLTISRDAVDLLNGTMPQLLDRPQTVLVVAFAQLQKIFQSVFYPKVLTFSMNLSNLVEAVHKFTVTYPVAIAVFHQDNLIVSFDGNVVTTPFINPMQIWRGITATKAAAYLLWSPNKIIESISSSVVSGS